MADRAVGRGLPPPLEPVRVGGPAPTATTVLPPSDKSSGHPEERQCPGGKPCRWAQRVTPAPSCPHGAAAEPEGGEGAGVGMSRKWRRQQLDLREVLGALRAVSCCLRQPPSLPAGREERQGGEEGRSKASPQKGSLGTAKPTAGPRRAERAGIAAPVLRGLPSPCGGPEKWQMGGQVMWVFL